MLIVTAVGFQNFYLHGRAAGGEMTAKIVPLIVTHLVGVSQLATTAIFWFSRNMLIGSYSCLTVARR